MKIFGWPVPFTEKVTDMNTVTPISTPVRITSPWGWIVEAFSGMWQRNLVMDTKTLLAFSAVFACVSLISGDISKLRIKLLRLRGGFWVEDTSPAFSPVLRKPNHYQTWLQFVEAWVISKLVHGNTYVLKQRDDRNVVVELHVLNAQTVTPLVAPDSSVFYQISADNLPGLPSGANSVPESEIIHDRWNCLFHQLVGIPPLYASAASSTQGTRIQSNSAVFFQNMSRPSGMLTVPGDINDDQALRIKEQFERGFGGDNIGRILVGSNGMTFEPFTIPAQTSQLIEQLKWTAEDVARAFLVPLYKIGAAPIPTNLAEADQEYYKTVLQRLIEAIEILLDEGLALPVDVGVEFDLDQLLRMDKKRRYETLEIGARAAILSPNEARASEGYAPTIGGESPMMQQQNYSLAALAKRDAREDPFAPATATTAAPPEDDTEDDTEEDTTPEEDAADTEQEDAAKQMRDFLKHVEEGLRCESI